MTFSNLGYERRLQALERFMREIRGDRGATALTAWTPAFAGSSTAGTFTYTIQTGLYCLVGNVCFVSLHLQISAITVAPVGNMRITGLPVTAANVTSLNPAISPSFYTNINLSANCVQLCGQINPADTIIRLTETFDNAASADFPAASFTNATERIAMSGFYFV